MYRDDNVCQQVAERPDESYASLTEAKVYGIVEQG